MWRHHVMGMWWHIPYVTQDIFEQFLQIYLDNCRHNKNFFPLFFKSAIPVWKWHKKTPAELYTHMVSHSLEFYYCPSLLSWKHTLKRFQIRLLFVKYQLLDSNWSDNVYPNACVSYDIACKLCESIGIFVMLFVVAYIYLFF